MTASNALDLLARAALDYAKKNETYSREWNRAWAAMTPHQREHSSAIAIDKAAHVACDALNDANATLREAAKEYAKACAAAAEEADQEEEVERRIFGDEPARDRSAL